MCTLTRLDVLAVCLHVIPASLRENHVIPEIRDLHELIVEDLVLALLAGDVVLLLLRPGREVGRLKSVAPLLLTSKACVTGLVAKYVCVCVCVENFNLTLLAGYVALLLLCKQGGGGGGRAAACGREGGSDVPCGGGGDMAPSLPSCELKSTKATPTPPPPRTHTCRHCSTRPPHTCPGCVLHKLGHSLLMSASHAWFSRQFRR